MARTDDDQRAGRVGTDQLFTALSHSTRRRTLLALATDDPRRLDEVEPVASGHAETDGERGAIALHHAHLPMLDEAGFIDWEPGADRVFRGEHFEQIRPFVELIEDRGAQHPNDWP